MQNMRRFYLKHMGALYITFIGYNCLIMTALSQNFE